MDCVESFEISLEEAGARVVFLSDYVTAQQIVDHVEAETWFTVTCQEAIEDAL